MTEQTRARRVHERWAHFRFSIIGQLLAAPPSKGELASTLAAPDDGRAHPVRLLDDRALVLPRIAGTR
jgi:hypothetical protein